MRQTSIIYVATRLPSKLSDELTLAGYRVWEAFAISEVLHLIEHEDVDCVVVAADVVDAKKKIIAAEAGRVCILLEPNATTAGVIWELTHLFPTATPVQ
jgi:hypothetical protein